MTQDEARRMMDKGWRMQDEKTQDEGRRVEDAVGMRQYEGLAQAFLC